MTYYKQFKNITKLASIMLYVFFNKVCAGLVTCWIWFVKTTSNGKCFLLDSVLG